jgi:cytochrome bd ubiquinol oxidase subunit II
MTLTLSDIWFVLFIVVIGGYLILDGFDMGVGILHLPFAHTDEERRVLLNSIGPVWDGNEVWLILGGGVLFAAFPFVYASLFSGFYLAMMLVLLVMILRTVAIEFRSKRASPRWRTGWDVVFALSSAGLALLLGVAFGNVVKGVTLGPDGNIRMSLFELLGPIPLLVGLTTVAMFAMHGSIFLSMKTGEALQGRIKAWMPRLLAIFFALNTLLIVALVAFHPSITDRYVQNPWLVVFPAAALGAILAAWYLLRIGRMFWAFVASSAMVFLLLVSAAVGIFPNLLISTLSEANNLTIYNAASEDNTLTVMLVIALIGLPFVLLYTAGVYYFFRGKTVVEPTGY